MMPLILKKLIVGMLFLAAATTAQAACEPRNLWPDLRKNHPAAARAAEERAAAMPHGEGRLFRLTREGRKPSYVLGTVHIHDPRYIPLSPGILAAFDRTSATVLEVAEINSENPLALLGDSPAAAMGQMFAPVGERPLDFLTVEEQGQLSRMPERLPMPVSTLLTMRPAFLALLLGLVSCEQAGRPEQMQGVDAELEKLSRLADRPVFGLETILEQLQSANDIPLDMQKTVLRMAIRSLPSVPDMNETLKSLYVDGKTGLIVALMRAEEGGFAEVFGNLPPVYLDKLIDERNRRMRDRALPFLRNGEALIAVGAAHLPGEQGLLKLLENEGYRIEKVE